MKITIELSTLSELHELRELLAHLLQDPLSSETPGKIQYQSVKFLQLSERTLRALRSENIFLINDLLKFSSKRLHLIPNLGRMVIQEIESKLLDVGLSLMPDE